MKRQSHRLEILFTVGSAIVLVLMNVFNYINIPAMKHGTGRLRRNSASSVSSFGSGDAKDGAGEESTNQVHHDKRPSPKGNNAAVKIELNDHKRERKAEKKTKLEASYHPLLSKFNISTAIDPIYREIKNSEDSALTDMTCAAGGKYPFKMHSGGICDWVCNNLGEKRVTAVMQKVFNEGCQNDQNLMLDVGSNHGYYGLLAMKMGCESLLFDLQPECHQMINNAIVVNGFTNVGRVIPSGVSDSVEELKVPNNGCEGAFPASAHREGTFDKGEIVVPLTPLGHFINDDQPILMMKVDTEGNEHRVLKGAMPFFEHHLIQHAIVEVTPGFGFWQMAGITKEEVALTFAAISKHGYTMVSLEDYSVLSTPSDVADFIIGGVSSIGQYDMWITLLWLSIDESPLIVAL